MRAKTIDLDKLEDKDDGLPNLQKSKSIQKPEDLSEYLSQILIIQEDKDDSFDDSIYDTQKALVYLKEYEKQNNFDKLFKDDEEKLPDDDINNDLSLSKLEQDDEIKPVFSLIELVSTEN